jgi:lipoprotein LprG
MAQHDAGRRGQVASPALGLIRHSSAAWLAFLLVVFSIAGCRGEKGGLPEAEPLLESGAKAMAGVRSVRFNLDVEGTLSGLQVKEAAGVMTREGEVSARAQILQQGQLVEYEYIVADGVAYLKGPTGGFQTLPQALAVRIYDPSALLDETAGLRRAMAGAQDPKTEAAETIDGQPAYRIRAKVSTDLVQGLSVLSAGQRRLDATLWVDQESGRLIQARIPFKPTGSGEQTVFTVRLSDFNDPVDIKPPQP